MAFTRTHVVYNPTGAGVTVNGNTVNSHAAATLTISDADAFGFKTAGCTVAQVMPGTADAAHLIGYTKGTP